VNGRSPRSTAGREHLGRLPGALTWCSPGHIDRGCRLTSVRATSPAHIMCEPRGASRELDELPGHGLAGVRGHGVALGDRGGGRRRTDNLPHPALRALLTRPRGPSNSHFHTPIPRRTPKGTALSAGPDSVLLGSPLHVRHERSRPRFRCPRPPYLKAPESGSVLRSHPGLPEALS